MLLSPSVDYAEPPKPERKTPAVHPFFNKKSQGGTSSSGGTSGSQQSKIHWHTPLGPEQSCLFGEFLDPLRSAITKNTSNAGQRQKIAAFDLDGTLIHTASGNAPYNFVDENDFQLWGRNPRERDTVLAKLKEEHESGALLVLITSQMNLDRKPARLKFWKARLGHILRRVGVPMLVFASLRKDVYRKPCAGWVEDLRKMWREAGGTRELDVDVHTPGKDEDQAGRSFFVGDAAGRTPSAIRKAKDFADTDRKLAHNLHWRFYTPEEYFCGDDAEHFVFSGYRPSSPAPSTASHTATNSDSARATLQALRERLLETTSSSTSPSLVILVGPQASGKSHFAQRLEAESGGNWVRVNQDTLKTAARCIKAAEAALKEGKSVIVDNTNPARATRANWTDLIKRHWAAQAKGKDGAAKGRIVCVCLDLSREQAEHNDGFRSRRWLWPSPTSGAEAPLRAPMPAIAFNMYYKNFETPDAKKEGFDEVVHVKFEFDHGEDAEEGGVHRRAWSKWYS